jgi:tripartite-type tricarboxylate transporter receptor subunit TctC
MTDPSERMSPNHAMRQILAALALLLWFAPLQGSQAQDFPNKPVHFIVPYAAGGSGDLLARLLGDKLSKLWGQQVVVDNKPGAGGLIGTEAGAHADPDGYTIYLATDGPLTIAATLHRKVPYDWKRDFAPISMMAVGYQILLSSPKLPAANLKEFVALAQQNPGKYNFASIGIGSAPHLAAELFLSLAGLKLTHVPYRGSSQQSIAALIAGDVQMFVVGTSTAVPFVKAGTVHGLAVTAPKRLDSLPEVHRGRLSRDGLQPVVRGAGAGHDTARDRAEAARRHCPRGGRPGLCPATGHSRLRGAVQHARRARGLPPEGLREIPGADRETRPESGLMSEGEAPEREAARCPVRVGSAIFDLVISPSLYPS